LPRGQCSSASQCENLTAIVPGSRPAEVQAARRGLFHFLIPVLATGIQPAQVLGLKERFPRRRRGAALISVTSTRDENEETLQSSEKFPTAPRIL
jgi:hypothetical protein